MKRENDPYQMTLRQFLLFLVLGGTALIWLCLEVSMRLHVGGEKVYAVKSYGALDRALSHTEGLLLPDESALPVHDGADYFVLTSSTSKLARVKDGYEIHLGGGDDYALLCAREADPSFDDDLPLRADQVRHGTDIEVENTDAHVCVRFLRDGWLYRLYERRGDDDAIDRAASLDTLLNITDDILQQAG